MSILVSTDFIWSLQVSIGILEFGKLKGIEGGQNSLMSISFIEVDFQAKSPLNGAAVKSIRVIEDWGFREET